VRLNKHKVLTIAILAGLVLGVVLGEALYQTYNGEVPAGVLESLLFVGDTIFIGLLKMILIPLIAASVIVGVASIDPAQLGRVGGLTVLYYVGTMALAVTLGLVLVSAIQPGDPKGTGEGLGPQILAQGEQAYSAEEETTRQRIEKQAKAGERGVLGALWASARNITSQIIPSNPIGAAANGEILPVIAFSILFGVALAIIGEPGLPVLRLFRGVFTAVMHMVEWILWLAPVGVFCLIAWAVARIGSAALLGPLGTYMMTVLVGLLLHAVVVLPVILWLFARVNPFRFMHQMRSALMTALGTVSSSATLPVTMDAAETEGAVSQRSSRFVLPLGATINMDGTALYEAIAVVFLFQAYGIDLSMTQLVIVMITATLAAIGAAGIPSAGLVTMVIVVEAVNNSLGATASVLPIAAVGLILGVDRILDACRTTVNVWGDSVGAKIISRFVPDPAPDQPAANATHATGSTRVHTT